MVYIEIIYLILYSIICYLVVEKIHKNKVNAIHNDYVSKLDKLTTESKDLKNSINSYFVETREIVLSQNKQYLSEINDKVSKQLKELSDNVKNRPII